MKNFIFSAFIAVGLALGVAAFAALPTYKTLSSIGGTAAAPANVLFPSDPNSQIRVIYVLGMTHICHSRAARRRFTRQSPTRPRRASRTSWITQTGWWQRGRWC